MKFHAVNRLIFTTREEMILFRKIVLKILTICVKNIWKGRSTLLINVKHRKLS